MNCKKSLHSQPTLLIDGWHLSASGVGLGVYAERVVTALLRHARSAFSLVRIVLPQWAASKDIAPAIRDVGTFLPCVRTGHRLVDQAVWQNRLALWSRQLPARDGVFFSPGPFWALRPPCSCVVAFHDCIYRHFPRYLGRSGIRKWLVLQSEEFLKSCMLVVTQSFSAQQDLLRFQSIGPDCIRIIPAWLPEGYEKSLAREQAARVREKYGLPASPYWLYVGGYDYRKNVEFLLDAYALASSRLACPPLVLAGRIPFADRTQTLCDVRGRLCTMVSGRGQVLTPGFVAAEDMSGLYGGASLFIYPSLFEGYGLPPLEAMGCGCPAIVADNSSLQEVVQDADYRFSTVGCEVLAHLLACAAQSPLKMNPSFDAEHYSELTAATRYISAFKQALVAHTPGALEDK